MILHVGRSLVRGVRDRELRNNGLNKEFTNNGFFRAQNVCNLSSMTAYYHL